MDRVVRVPLCLLLALPRGAPALKVLDVGAPRTGTQTLHKAFKILNYTALHSGYNSRSRSAAQDYIFDGGSLEPVMGMFERYDVAMDEPFQLLYPEVMQRFPEAKFVLTMQPSPEEWYASYERFVRQFKHVPTVVEGLNVSILQGRRRLRGAGRHQPLGLSNIPNLIGPSRGRISAGYFNCEFERPRQTLDTVQMCLDGYSAHNANVQRMIPPKRLLVFNLTDGWEPLCAFLGVPVPSEPFPFIDEFAASPYGDTETDLVPPARPLWGLRPLGAPPPLGSVPPPRPRPVGAPLGRAPGRAGLS